MSKIEVEFGVYKQLVMLQQSEDETLSEVIERLIESASKTRPAASIEAKKKGLSIRGVWLPHGTELLATYKGKEHRARIDDGVWLDEHGQARTSPSDAAARITRTNVNGWRFWHARRPGERSFVRLDRLTR